MKQVVIRRIGTGEDTLIWEHNWIPRKDILLPITSVVVDPPTLVDSMIDQPQ